MPRLVRRHALAVRLAHWLNVPVLAVMVWSGIAISPGKAPYTLTIFGHTFEFFSSEFFWQYPFPDLALAIGYHFTFAWLFLGSGFLYVGWTVASGHWRGLIPRRGSPRDAWRVLLRDCGKTSIPAPPRGE